MITFRDATSRQVQETKIRQESKMQAVGLLAAGIAHDFNNMLCVILGYTEIVCLPAGRCHPQRSGGDQEGKRGCCRCYEQLLKFTATSRIEKQDVDLNAMIGTRKKTYTAWPFRR